MKKLFALLIFTALAGMARAQVMDTIPQLIPVMDSSHYYDVYYGNGRIKKRNAVYPFTIPSRGYTVQRGFVNSSFFAIEGYAVLKTRPDTVVVTVNLLNSQKQPIPSPYITVWWNMPVDGFNYKRN